jgi:hypothetical protein
MTEEKMLAGALESRRGASDPPWEQHHIDVGVMERKPMDDIATGGDKGHG